MKLLFTTILILLLTALINPQELIYVKGKVVYVSENNVEEKQSGVTVFIEETGDRDRTDNDGIFRIFLNDMFEAGDRITLKIENEDWAIRDPLFGKTYVPSDPQKELIKLNILPKGSPLFFTDQQITSYIEYLILKQTTERAISKVDYSKLTLETLLDTMANNWGFSVSEIKSTVQNWIEKVIYDTSKFYERGLAEYSRKNFEIAGRLFKQSADVRINHFRIIDEDFKKLSQERQAIIKQTTRDLRLSGESYFEVKHYDSSMIAYKNAIEFLNYAEDWETLASTLNRVATCYYYLSLKSYDESIFEHLDSATSYLSRGLDLSQNKSLEKWKWKFKGNLAILLAEREIFSVGKNKSQEILKAITTLESVEEIRQKDMGSKDRFLVRNNIGVCYHLLYEFTKEQEEANHFLNEAILSYNSIKNDSSFKSDFSLEWAYVNYNSLLSSNDDAFHDFSMPHFYQMMVFKIQNMADLSVIKRSYLWENSSFIKSLNDVYTRLLETEKVIKKENNALGMASTLNFLAFLRFQFMLYSQDYLNDHYIQITDSLISVANDLAMNDNIFRGEINAIANKALLTIIKYLNYGNGAKEEIIRANGFIEKLLEKKDILLLYKARLKSVLMLTNFTLSNLSIEHSIKTQYLFTACKLNKEVAKNYKELNYFRMFDEIVIIRELLNCPN